MAPVTEVQRITHELLARRSSYWCEIRAPGCTSDATDWHHRQRRNCGDDTITNALHACRACHRWTHAHPTAARALGWIVPTWADPARTPVRIRGRWVLLTPTAGKEPTPPPEEAGAISGGWPWDP